MHQDITRILRITQMQLDQQDIGHVAILQCASCIGLVFEEGLLFELLTSIGLTTTKTLLAKQLQALQQNGILSRNCGSATNSVVRSSRSFTSGRNFDVASWKVRINPRGGPCPRNSWRHIWPPMTRGTDGLAPPASARIVQHCCFEGTAESPCIHPLRAVLQALVQECGPPAHASQNPLHDSLQARANFGIENGENRRFIQPRLSPDSQAPRPAGSCRAADRKGKAQGRPSHHP